MRGAWFRGAGFFYSAQRRRADRSGVILIVVLWLLMILTSLAMGLGWRKSVDVSLLRYSLGQQRAKYIAWSGVAYAMRQITIDSRDEESKEHDTLSRCGFALHPKQTVEDIFKQVPVGEGHFDIGDFFFRGEDQVFVYGFQDEDSKVNLNAVDSNNFGVLSQLLQVLGYDEDLSEQIAASVADWRDEDEEITGKKLGAETDQYAQAGFSYGCKNKPFDAKEELLLVRGVTPEIFEKVSPYLTIFPKAGEIRVNLDTASEVVFEALARDATRLAPNATLRDAKALTEKVLNYRQGEDHQAGTPDDRILDGEKIGLNSRDFVLWNELLKQRTVISNFLRVRVKAVDSRSRAVSRVTAVIRRADLAVLSWHRE